MKCDKKTTKIIITEPSDNNTSKNESQPVNWSRLEINNDYELEDLLLQHPILPPNPHFFCCFQQYHITVRKIINIFN